MKAQRVCFLFTPFGSPTYVPLGLSCLKGYLAQELPSVKVKNYDLSNRYYHRFTDEKFFGAFWDLAERQRRLGKRPSASAIGRAASDSLRKATIVALQEFSNPRSKHFYEVRSYNHLRRQLDEYTLLLQVLILRYLKSFLGGKDPRRDKFLTESLFYDDIDLIKKFRPTLIGFSIFSEEQLAYSLVLARLLKQTMNTKIIFGGALANRWDQKGFMRLFPFVDFVMYGEGEPGIVSLLKNLRTQNFAEVPNLVYRQNHEVIINNEASVASLDDLPCPNFNDFALYDYFSPAPVISTRYSKGCAWGRCRFCAASRFRSQEYRIKSLSLFLDELEQYDRQGIRHVSLTDSMISASQARKISLALIARGITMNLSALARPTRDFDTATLKVMFRAGFRIIFWGVESTCPRLLKLMDKGTDAADVKDLLKRAHAVGIENAIYMIGGLPTETREEIIRDRKFMKSFAPYCRFAAMSHFLLWEDSGFARDFQEYGLRRLKRSILIRTGKGKLTCWLLDFSTKKKIDWPALEKQLLKSQLPSVILKGFNDMRPGYASREHMILHAGLTSGGIGDAKNGIF